MIYQTLNSQTVSIGTDEIETTILAIKVEYYEQELDLKHVKVFEFSPIAREEDIQDEIIRYGREWMNNEYKTRSVNISGVIE